MSIATKTGDAGTTALMYNRRVSKCHPRVEAYGCVDELNAGLGMARAQAEQEALRQSLLAIQKDLVVLMGELATINDDLEKYVKSGHVQLTPQATEKLDSWIRDLEARKLSFRGWATPGGTVLSAALDLARTICRRAERRVCALQESGELRNPEIVVYLNRLSDLLWLLARQAEQEQAPTGPRLV